MEGTVLNTSLDNIKYLSKRDILKKPKFSFVLETIHLQPFHKGQNSSILYCSWIVLISEISLVLSLHKAMALLWVKLL